MSSLLYVLGRWAVKARKLVVALWVVILACLGVGVLLFGGTLNNDVSIPGTESGDALAQLSATFPQVSGTTAQLIVAGPEGAKIDSGQVRDDIDIATADLAQVPGVEVVTAIDDPLMPAEIGTDGSAALITIQLSGAPTDITAETKAELQDISHELSASLPSDYVAHMGGQLFATEFPALSLTEAAGVLIALVVLALTLGTLLAAGLPIVIALVGVGVSSLLIFLGAALTAINTTTPLLSVMLGLAVGIDYSLFIVSRHRDQVRSGMDVPESIARALGTSGSAVVFAGVTVMIALLGLSVAGIPFLTTMGIAGSIAVGIAVLLALTLLPALLGFLGKGILSRKEQRAPQRKEAKPNRFFQGWLTVATKIPALTIVVVIVAVGLLSLPALHLRLALPDAGVLPEDNEARQAYDLTAEEFGPGYNGMLIVSTPILKSDDPLTLMHDVGERIASLPEVESVPVATPNETIDTGIVQVIPKSGPESVETEQLVHDIRALHDELEADYDVDISVTGMTAVGIDVSAKLSAALLPFALVVVGLSLILLLIVFRSIAIPLSATIGYLLSVCAAFGTVTAIFSDGVGASLFGVSRLGPVLNFMPIVVMGILFGLSMDYEVFLVSRMREEHVRTGKSQEAVKSGFLSSAKVVTAAAVIMVSVFVAFVPNGDANIKPIALGLAVGVAIDAFVVRMTLIPAVMVLLGKATWWMPRWLDRLLPSFDIEGEGVLRQRSLSDWPGHDTLIAAKDVKIGKTSHSFMVPSGNSVLVKGDDPEEIRDLMLVFSGRKTAPSGALKILGYLLPERAGAVRHHVAYVDASVGSLDEQLRRAQRERAGAIAVNLGREDIDLSPLVNISPKIPIMAGTALQGTEAPTGWHELVLNQEVAV